MGKEIKIPEQIVYVCTGSKCKKKGGKEISKLLRVYAKEHELNHVGIIKTHCTDNCKHAPVVCFQPKNAWHFDVDEPKAIELLKKYSELK
jgi:NADH:ubiquinone oxidoreductase subunit E